MFIYKFLKFIKYFYILTQSIFTVSLWENWGKICVLHLKKLIRGKLSNLPKAVLLVLYWCRTSMCIFMIFLGSDSSVLWKGYQSLRISALPLADFSRIRDKKERQPFPLRWITIFYTLTWTFRGTGSMKILLSTHLTTPFTWVLCIIFSQVKTTSLTLPLPYTLSHSCAQHWMILVKTYNAHSFSAVASIYIHSWGH